MFINYKPFLPETSIEGRRGFYPCANVEEWNALPLPLRCATWYRTDIKSVLFDTWFSNYNMRATVEVHPEYVFKALFTSSNAGTLLYSITGVRLENGDVLGAKWQQDTKSGAFAICYNDGECIASQGGYRGHMPENCIDKGGGEWGLEIMRTGKTTHSHARCCLV